MTFTLRNKRVLITGGAGFIGSNFIHFLLNQKEPPVIINYDALTYAGTTRYLEQVPNKDRYNFVHGNICDHELVNRILHEFEINTIIHFAAESHVDRSITGPAAFIQTNFVGTFTLLEAARQYWLSEKHWTEDQCHFHHISTDEVYGSLKRQDPAFTEITPYAPNSPYSASKAGSDHLVRAYFHTYGLPVTTTNCSNNYGPFQHPEKFIPTIIRACLEQRPIPVYGDGSNIRDWLYVLDHCKGIESVIKNGQRGETYNIGGNNEQNNLQIAQTICALMDEIKPVNTPHKKLIQFVKDRPGHDWRYAIDITKIATELGWKPEETFESGLRKTIEFYLKEL
ncbi:MAG: dTDP-glucose 4,6-dehydratase [Pseudomonadota bacterium]|nr:dTDP-glucose 4,6-dehydratase [Gammaproteobacteria bacterium]MBU1558988.1 dTDP-glucose 4,6-dehydratase [Gammaproteobacteria bacterium]MBU1926855.1 dTDP-glucose 4,6-dehydratase [Gammaproteobacteria bacterium]MBU2546148.1 dTDP-glucose 4,6-dehydratase [Gammaproteobacteria bacterium]